MSTLHDEIYYPRLVRRVRAYLIDGLVFALVVYGWWLALPWLAKFSVAQRIAALVLPMIALEPCMVSLTGGTIGHHLQRLRIRDAWKDQPIGFFRALIRALLRLSLGVPSILFIFVTRRRQALHDLLVGTLVVIDRVQGLPPHDLLSARELAHEPVGMPGRARRIAIVVLYGVFGMALVAYIGQHLISAECKDYDMCSRRDDLIGETVGFVLLAVMVAAVFFGMRGKLWGARRKKPAAVQPPVAAETSAAAEAESTKPGPDRPDAI